MGSSQPSGAHNRKSLAGRTVFRFGKGYLHQVAWASCRDRLLLHEGQLLRLLRLQLRAQYMPDSVFNNRNELAVGRSEYRQGQTRRLRRLEFSLGPCYLLRQSSDKLQTVS
jgi:hypothetical protein